MQDAFNRSIVVSQNTGVRALLVHALNDRAKQFYEHYGFQESPQHPMTLMLRLNNYKVPNLVTRNAIEELELGQGKHSNTFDELMADLNERD